MQPGFAEKLANKWSESSSRRPENYYSLDAWHGSLCFVRQFLKGWNIQMIGHQNKVKTELLQDLERMDRESNLRDLTTEEWHLRYEIEAHLEHIYEMVETYWQQRVGDRWTIKGDSNSKIFHRYANGRRRKSTIISLESDQGEIRGQDQISQHIVDFYKGLFGPPPIRMMSLAHDFWDGYHKLPEGERDNLDRPFSKVEIKQAIFGNKSESAPGPNGDGVSFFKKFWETIKGD